MQADSAVAVSYRDIRSFGFVSQETRCLCLDGTELKVDPQAFLTYSQRMLIPSLRAKPYLQGSRGSIQCSLAVCNGSLSSMEPLSS